MSRDRLPPPVVPPTPKRVSNQLPTAPQPMPAPEAASPITTEEGQHELGAIDRLSPAPDADNERRLATGARGQVKEALSFIGQRKRSLVTAIGANEPKTFVLAALTWAAAIGMCVVAGSAVDAARHTTFDVRVASQKFPQVPQIQLTPPPPERLRFVLETVRAIHPGIRTEATPRGTVIISAPSTRDLRVWMNAVKSLENSSERLRWSVVEMCVGASCRTNPLSAELLPRAITIR